MPKQYLAFEAKVLLFYLHIERHSSTFCCCSFFTKNMQNTDRHSSRTESSNMAASRHMWLFKFKLCKTKN